MNEIPRDRLRIVPDPVRQKVTVRDVWGWLVIAAFLAGFWGAVAGFVCWAFAR